MRVCLVAPPTLEQYDEGPVARTDSSLNLIENCPLGVLSLAAVLEQHSINPIVLDLNRLYFECSWRDRLYFREVDFCSLAVSELLAVDFDVLGLSTMCSTYPLSLRIAREFKKARPETPIVLGGPQASVVDLESLAAFSFIDFVVRGEADESFPALLEALSGSGKIDDVQGLSYRRNGAPVRTPNAAPILDLDALPLPAFHLFPGSGKCRAIPLELGRGCPFACTFCSTNDFFRRRFRLKSPGKMIEQMTAVSDLYGTSCFELVHDMFTVDRRRVVAFCDALLACGRKFSWTCSARTDCVDNELLQLMADAGCTGIFFGVESGSSRMQKVFGKGLDLSEATRLVEYTGSIGIPITVSMIDGFPEEEEKDLRDTVSFLLEATRYDHVKPQINLLAPLAKTPITERFRQQLVFDDVFSDMSCHGWHQNPADLDLITRYPDIFPNFYGLPSILNRVYLDEFNRFFMQSLVRFKWLIVALHQASGSLLEIFNLWLNYRVRAQSSTRYYATPEFARDFRRFLREAGKQSAVLQSPIITILIEYYDVLDEHLPRLEAQPIRVASDQRVGRFSFESVPSVAASIGVLPLPHQVKDAIECLREHRTFEAAPADSGIFVARPDRKGMVDLYRIPPLSAQIVQLCDGRRPVDQIVRMFAQANHDMKQVDPEDLCVSGLRLLQETGVIAFHRTANKRQPKTSSAGQVGKT
jgi:radical SAM superfamily enzyme YgiQ (UPF0313 family)